MTTALIGKQVAVANKARVAWIASAANPTLDTLFRRLSHELRTCESWDEFARVGAEAPFDLVLCDEGHAASRPESALPSLVVNETGQQIHGLGAIAVGAIESVLPAFVVLCLELADVRGRLRDARRLMDGLHTGSALLGSTPVMRRLQGTLSRAADCDVTTLIEGPVGSGKSLVARIIHCKSRRGGAPIAGADAAELTPENLARVIDASRSTTLVIEDVDELPQASQASLVRHLKERNAKQQAPRIVVTTSAHLPEMVAKGGFREDLLYRLHAFPIVVPALRERLEDIPSLAANILQASVQVQGATATTFTPSALMLLESMAWPGNVTQLEATVQRARISAGGGTIDREHLIPTIAANSPAVGPTVAREDTPAAELTEDSIRPFEEEEQSLLTRALRATKGNVRRAAQLLGIGRATLYRKIQQYRLRLQ